MRRKLWTPAEEGLLRKSFATVMVRAIARQLGRPISSVRGKVTKLGLAHSPERRRELQQLAGAVGAHHPNAIAHRIPKGNVPLNKGLRRPGYSIGRGRMCATTFKKGQRPKNFVPIGSIRIVDGYKYVKVSDAPEPPGHRGGQSLNWEVLHHKVWQDAGNPPINRRTHVLIFKDGDRKNCALDNLEVITRRQNRIRNSIHNLFPHDVKLAVMALGALKRKLRRSDEQRNDGRSAGNADGDAAQDARGEGKRHRRKGDRERVADAHQFVHAAGSRD